jgi:galactokinase
MSPGLDPSHRLQGFVPGRIEVFGRHTDYAGGRTIVCAVDRGFRFTVQRRADQKVTLKGDRAEFEEVQFQLDPELSPRVGAWSNYPMTMAKRMVRNFPGSLRGADISFSSSLPVGSGMSGSSALMMMVFTALAASNRLEADPRFQASIRTPIDLAVYLACAENGQSFRDLSGDRGVGTFGGSEDHAAILTSRADYLSLFSFSPPELLAEVPWPPVWRMAIAFSGVRAEKTREALEKYNMAARRVQDAVEVFNRLAGTKLGTLREVVDHEPKPISWWEDLDRSSGSAGQAPALADRVRQFILEDRTHIPGAIEALRRADLQEFGRLLSESHRASREFLWNIVPEVDFLQRSAIDLGAAGASGFGAGFGGSILAVTTDEHAEAFLQKWRQSYTERHPERAAQSEFFLARPSPGIQIHTEAGPVRYVDTIFSPCSSPGGL